MRQKQEKKRADRYIFNLFIYCKVQSSTLASLSLLGYASFPLLANVSLSLLTYLNFLSLFCMFFSSHVGI